MCDNELSRQFLFFSVTQWVLKRITFITALAAQSPHVSKEITLEVLGDRVPRLTSCF